MSEKFRISCLVNDCAKNSYNFWGEHGISFLIETETGRVLFDTGTTPDVISHNLDALEKDLKGVSHIVLSHGHYDHTGGLKWVLTQTRSPMVVADPDIFIEKYSSRDHIHSIGIPATREEIESRARLNLTEERYEIAEGITVSGRIPRITLFEPANENMLVKGDEGLTIDTFPDDRCLILESDKGLVVILGCCHAGLINTLEYIKETINKPVHAVLGGTHMVVAGEERIAKTIALLQEEYRPEALYLNHCTGLDAFIAFRNCLGDKMKPFPAGTVLDF